MAEAAATNPGMERYNRYYNAVLQQLQADQGPERSDSQLKNYLQKMIRPSYDQAIAQRQRQTGQANAAIDTDAASRGMGTSTWVTDAKNRQQQAASQDIANLNSNYNQALYEALLAQIQQREQNRMSLMGQAQSIAGNMYDRWKAEDDALKAAGAGGGGAGGSGGGSKPGRRNPGDGEDVDPNYGAGTNPLTKATDLLKETDKKGTLTTPSYSKNLTQVQRESLGLDDKINGQQQQIVTRNPLVNQKTTVDPYSYITSKGTKRYGLDLQVKKR